MKKLGLLMMLLLLSRIALFCQAQTAGIEEKEVLRNEDVIFHQIDEHTWFGTGHLMANESLYLVEGETKAILIDAGTKIKDLDKLVASITDKPVTLVATHVHPDHTGSAIDYFPEIYINPADTIGIPEFMPNYKGKVCFLTDGEILDLGGRTLEVVFTPGFFRLPHRLYNVACHENRVLRHDLFVVVVLGLCCLLCFCCRMQKGRDTLLTIESLS